MNQIIHGDCLEVMRTLPDASVDMILCDPPYGALSCEWDTVLDLSKFWPELLRVTKHNAAIIITAQQPFATDVINGKRDLFKYEIVWEKSMAGGFLDANRRPLRCHENILVFYRALPTYIPQKTAGKREIRKNRKASSYSGFGKFGESSLDSSERYPSDVVKIANGNFGSEHPTQKPVALFEYLIRTYTNEGDTVLDPTAGSCTTAIAALKCKRKYICIEQSEEYCKIGERRVKELHPSLFD